MHFCLKLFFFAYLEGLAIAPKPLFSFFHTSCSTFKCEKMACRQSLQKYIGSPNTTVMGSIVVAVMVAVVTGPHPDC